MAERGAEAPLVEERIPETATWEYLLRISGLPGRTDGSGGERRDAPQVGGVLGGCGVDDLVEPLELAEGEVEAVPRHGRPELASSGERVKVGPIACVKSAPVCTGWP